MLIKKRIQTNCIWWLCFGRFHLDEYKYGHCWGSTRGANDCGQMSTDGNGVSICVYVFRIQEACRKHFFL